MLGVGGGVEIQLSESIANFSASSSMSSLFWSLSLVRCSFYLRLRSFQSLGM